MPQFSRIGKKSLTVIGLEEQWVKPSPKVDETELLHHTSQRTDQFGHLLQYAMLETKKAIKYLLNTLKISRGSLENCNILKE